MSHTPTGLEHVQRRRVIAPNAWQSEVGCLVGPFSSRTAAEHFAYTYTDFGTFDLCERVLLYQNDWHVEITPLA